ncbi:MAG TPA: hypothetical protein PKW95_01100 [bacterium]|nr:hypothetical protein [bacterium]
MLKKFFRGFLIGSVVVLGIIGAVAAVVYLQMTRKPPSLDWPEIAPEVMARAPQVAEEILARMPDRPWPLPSQVPNTKTRTVLSDGMDIGYRPTIFVEFKHDDLEEYVNLSPELELLSYRHNQSRSEDKPWSAEIEEQAKQKATDVIAALFGERASQYRFDDYSDGSIDFRPYVQRVNIIYRRYVRDHVHDQDKIRIDFDSNLRLDAIEIPDAADNNPGLNPVLVDKEEAIRKAVRVLQRSHMVQNNFRQLEYTAKAELAVVYPDEFWIDWLQDFLLIRNHVHFFYTHREVQRLAWVVTCEPDHNGVLTDFMWMTEIVIDAETGRIIGGGESV